MDHILANEPDARRYALRIDDQLVSVVDYSISDNRIALTRTYTLPPHRGHGYAAEIVEFAVNDIETTTNYRIVSSCWYVGVWFDQHPERDGLLTR